MMMTILYGNKNKSVAYSTGLSKLTGSMVSAVMLQFIIINWERDKRPKIWFNRPTDHPKYVTGASWEENYGLSESDVKHGLSFIGTRVTNKVSREEILKITKPQFDLKGKMVNSNYLVLYYSKNGMPHYELNAALAIKAVELQINGEWPHYMAPLSEAMKEIEEEVKQKPSNKSFLIPDEIGGNFDLVIPKPEGGLL